MKRFSYVIILDALHLRPHVCQAEETAENIVQDLMLWLWENRTVLCVSTSLPKYLFGAVRNNCLTYLGHESKSSGARAGQYPQ